ncbi:hypothetical protein BH11BAC7_BH11BAC7_16640 [soil metagenome]
MLRGGSLFYALAITIIMGLVSGSLLLSAFYTRLHLQRDQIREEVIRNSKSGLQLLLSGQAGFVYDDPKETDLFGDGSDSVRLEIKSWGAFEIAVSRAHNKIFSHELIAAVGWQCDAKDQTALILADLDRPLSITGTTKLTGDCYLPKAGIQRAYIEGQSYSGTKMVYGQIKPSERFLPKYNEELVERIRKLFDFIPGQTDSTISLEEIRQEDSITNSFLNKTLYVFSSGSISLQAEIIQGNVCIISRTAILVRKNTLLKNVLLIAPFIKIEDNTEGEFQAFARDSLIVGENVHLHYPTVLGIIATAKSPDVSAILIGEKSKISGQLFACRVETDFRKHVLIVTAKESIIHGEIYCSDLLDHKGTVYGSVTCSKFKLKTASAEYENHLMNAVINRTKRSPYYIASALTRKKTDRKAVIEWLH